MDRQLLEILVCPKSKKKLQSADSRIIEKVNDKINSGECRDISLNTVEEPLTDALLQPEEQILYPVRNEIPVMIYEQAIDISDL